VPGVDGLRGGAVDAGEGHHQLHLVAHDGLGSRAVERAVLLDAMEREIGPCQGRYPGARERQIVHPVDGLSFLRFLGADEDQLEFPCDDEVAAGIRHSEHEHGPAVHLRHQGPAREKDPGGRTGELGEDETGDGGDEEEAAEHLGDHQQVREGRLRIELTVSDGAHRLDAEEEGVGERSGPCVGDSVRQQIQNGETEVREQEGGDDDGQRPPPRCPQQRVVDVSRLRARHPHHDRRAARGLEDPRVVARLAHAAAQCPPEGGRANSQR